VIAAVALGPFALREQRRAQASADSVVPIALVGGLVFFLAASIQQFGIVTATVINTGLLTALYVLATPLVFWVVERQRPSPVIWLAVALASLGVWGLSGGSIENLSDGDLLVALAAMIWAVHIVVTGRSSRLAQPLTYTFVQFVVVAALAMSLAIAFEPMSLQAIVAAADSILYVGLLSSALTFGIMAIALQSTPVPKAAVLLSAEVLFSVAAGYLLLGERLSAIGWVGAALVLSAILAVRVRAI
jgi:drug/metabolite transporter (DMT)-like permease